MLKGLPPLADAGIRTRFTSRVSCVMYCICVLVRILSRLTEWNKHKKQRLFKIARKTFELNIWVETASLWRGLIWVIKLSYVRPYCEVLDQSWCPQIVSTWQTHGLGELGSYLADLIQQIYAGFCLSSQGISFIGILAALTGEANTSEYLLYLVLIFGSPFSGTMYLWSINYLGQSRLVQELTVGCYLG